MDGVRPHQQVPVQFSVYKLDAAGSLTHAEFLAEGPGERRALVQSLRKVIGDSGHCISWNKSFEIGCNRGLASSFSEYAGFLESINERTIDLMEVFKRDYVDIRFGRSTSIKKVLPILCPELSYDELTVENGANAMAAWLSMSKETDHVFKARYRKQLLEYCKLDTFAMVEIYRFLLRFVQEG